MTTKTAPVSLPDILGLGSLMMDGAAGVTSIAEEMHKSILESSASFSPLVKEATWGVAGLIYGSVRGGFRLTGAGLAGGAALIGQKADDTPASRGRAAALAALNGVVGDHLAESGNPLALTMQLRREGRALKLERGALAEALPEATGKIAVLAHGLCMSDRQWTRQGHDHGAALARDFGYTPVYLSYNSGLHISTNGRAFAALLEALVAEWPAEIEDFVVIGHSMGGLVARSACRIAEEEGRAWPRKLRKLVFLGTPHHGAPLERIGAWVDTIVGSTPYASALGRIGRSRSAGITDLRYGAVKDEDWQGGDRFARTPDMRQAVPLPEGVACYAIAATTASAPGALMDRLVGDGLVPVASALGRHKDAARALAFPAERQWIVREAGHFDLLSRRDVYERIVGWVTKDP